MRKYISSLTTSCFLLFVSILFSGCLKDTCRQARTYSWYEPIYKVTEQVKSDIKSNPGKEIQTPGKLFIIGNYIFLNEPNKGIHVIDNSTPSSPKNIAFIDIPGNVDMALKGNTLYADFYTDLVTLDVSDPLNVVKKSVVNNVFPERFFGNFSLNADGAQVIVDWKKHDTTLIVDCNNASPATVPGGIFYNDFFAASSSAQNSGAIIGQGGSMARFALANNYLYIADDINLNSYDITNGDQPVFASKVQVDWHLETIYPFKDKLFLGSNSGMFMYDINSSPATPVKVGEFTHVRACDPVIADDSFAYVTLHSGTSCLGYNNELDIVKLNDLSNAELVKTYNLTAPQGLSKDGDLLFICDGTDGLKVFDASDAMNLQLIKQFPGSETYDVIARNKIAIVVSKDGLYQYDYSNSNNIHLVSKMNISN